jgi:3',5'-nucleoside bisphosphate phosphatase
MSKTASTQRRFVDLHTHSTASDGACPPREVMRLADQARLAAVALTDHDTTAGLSEARQAAAQYPGLTLVPGIEISAKFPTGTLHILGLGIDPESATLAEALRRLQAARAERNPKIFAKLADLSVRVTMEEVLRQTGEDPAQAGASERIVGRLHIAQAMIAKGHVRSTQEAFDKYLATGRPAYVDKERLTPRQSIDAIRGAGGLAVLAHPVQLRYQNRLQLETIVRDLIGAGLGGIEAYHSDHSDAQVRLYLELACRFNLAISGGSDFHGPAKPGVMLGRPRVSITMIGSMLRMIGPKRPQAPSSKSQTNSKQQ